MRMKLTSSYDRIKSDLEVRRAIPGQQPHENWDVVPIVRQTVKNKNIDMEDSVLTSSTSS